MVRASRFDQAISADAGSVKQTPEGWSRPRRKCTPSVRFFGSFAAIIVASATFAAIQLSAEDVQPAKAPQLFLIATRKLIDPIFQQSVILMMAPRPGPLVAGLIINKPTNVPVSKLFQDAPALKNHNDMAYFGGPVELAEPSLVLNNPQPPGRAVRLFDGIYLSTEHDVIATLLKTSGFATDPHLFIGRAQWSRNQLEAEIQEGSWYVMRASAEPIFSPDPSHVWRELVELAELQKANATPPREPNVRRLIYWDEVSSILPLPPPEYIRPTERLPGAE